jgi:hypothetical protein
MGVLLPNVPSPNLQKINGQFDLAQYETVIRDALQQRIEQELVQTEL